MEIGNYSYSSNRSNILLSLLLLLLLLLVVVVVVVAAVVVVVVVVAAVVLVIVFHLMLTFPNFTSQGRAPDSANIWSGALQITRPYFG